MMGFFTESKIRIKGYLHKYFGSSFSSCGEDKILSYLFSNKKDPGFYVDVGAFEPVCSSNTYLFYLKGWHGIAIDANEDCLKRFRIYRPRDISIFAAVADCEKEATYYRFGREPSLNSLSPKSVGKHTEKKLKDRKIIKTRTLASILDEHLPKEIKIDFFSVDVEGVELEVLQSNNWEKYRPSIIIVESFTQMVEKDGDSQVNDFLDKQRYELIAKTPNGIIFKENSVRLSSGSYIVL